MLNVRKRNQQPIKINGFWFVLLNEQVTEEFHNVFGSELKAVTGDPKYVDDLLRRVVELTSPMEELAFDPFSLEGAHDWKLIMEEFKVGVSVSSTFSDFFLPYSVLYNNSL